MEAITPLDMCDEWVSDVEPEQENQQPNHQTVEKRQSSQSISASSSRTESTKCTAVKPMAAPAITVQDASTNTECPTAELPDASPKNNTTDNSQNNNKSYKIPANQPPVVYVPPQPPQLDEDIFGQEIRCGTNFDKNSTIPVKVSGDNVPAPIADFASSGLVDHLLQNIRKSGYTLPTPIQRHGIAAVLASRDLMACAQTGSGKTAAYLLGILHRLLTDDETATAASSVTDSANAVRPLAVVVTPTRELAVQIFNETRKFARGTYLRSCVLYGGTSVRYQLEQLQKGCHVLVATPGRLLEFVDKDWLQFSAVRFVVMDEADRMLDMGFLPEMQRFMDHPTMVATSKRQTLMFSATFPEEIQELAGRMLDAYVFVAVGIVGSACEDVQQTVRLVHYREKRDRLIELLEEDAQQQPEFGGAVGSNSSGGGTMVFVSTRRLADFLASYLSELGLLVTSIHGDRYQEQREKALSDFRTRRVHVIICTSVAARGLNIQNVQHVINYDMPNSIDDYVHRIGRTGRIGNQGRATTFFDPINDSVLASDLVKILDQANQEIPEFLLQQARTSDPAANSVQQNRVRNDFGGFDMRQNRRHGGNREPTAHEPLETW